jgi:DNA-binding response OmpR family regulator
LMQEITAGFKVLARRKNIELRFTEMPGQTEIMADPGKLEMIFNNLIYNAFKYTPSGGCIEISLSAAQQVHAAGTPDAGDQVCIAIQDNGSGIPPEVQAHVFERFFTTRKGEEGTGIGLSLTKSLVELHNGSITVDSTPHIKTIFKVFLPVTKVESEQPGQAFYQRPVEEIYALPSAGEPTHLQFSGSKQTQQTGLLLVEDNQDVMDYLCAIFEPVYQIKTARNGIEALEQLKNWEPDLIISDVMMPGMNGVELCHTLKSDIQTCHIPVILLTAKAEVNHVMEGYQQGADDYVAKPFHSGLLRIRAENLIENKRKFIEKFQSAHAIIPKNIARNPLDQAFMEKVLTYIEQHLGNEELSVEELGNTMAMSRSNLFRKVKAITGQTPVELIYDTRLKTAMKLLLERKLNVSEISYHVGFRSSSAFIKSFKKKYGKAPNEYLNQIIADHS